MEILIEIPPWVVEAWESLGYQGVGLYEVLEELSTSIWDVVSYKRNALWILLSLVVFWPLWVYFAVAVTTASGWIFWLFASLLLGVLQLVYVSYQFIMIAFDVMVLTFLKTYQVIMRSRFIQFLFFFSKRIRNSRLRTSIRRKWRKDCEQANDYASFLKIKVLEPKAGEGSDRPSPRKPPRRTHSFANLQTLHEEYETPALPPSPMKRMGSFDRKKFAESFVDDDQIDPRISEELGNLTADLLLSTTARLKEARTGIANGEDASSLKFLLSGVVKRNHLTLEDIMVRNARSVANSGQHEFSSPSRKTIATYYDEVTKSLDCLSDAPINTDDPLLELGNRMTLVRKMKQNMGRTALMLSGGGAQAMYHLGTIRALIDSNVYDDIKVISGTSGGSITAACCAMYTAKELYETICIPTVSTDFRLTGEMKEKNIRWFPPVMDMGTYWLKNRLLVDSKYFFRTCEFYYGSTTFAEAFEKTGKHVCITVSASRAGGGSGTAQRLLLNHISTPHVTLASAVAASCALPGVMKPAKLQTKNSLGDIEPFEVDGVEWIDGSVQADLPFQRISTLFNVSNYIVCQTNFHVVPFLNKDHHPSTQSLYWRLFQTIEWDIRSRALKLSRLGLFPRIFGQDISKVFKQKYHGNLTLVPRFTAAQTFGLKALVNPSVKEMEGYLKYGQLAVWPYVGVIRDMLRLERALDECLERLKGRSSQLYPEDDLSDTDDVDSLASGHSSFGHASINAPTFRNRVVRFSGQDKEVQRLRHRLTKSEEENRTLRREIDELKSLLVKKGYKGFGEEKKSEDKDTQIDLSEGGVWNLVRRLNFVEDSKKDFQPTG